MPSDFLAKQIIRLIWIVSKIVNEDRETSGKMSVCFIPNYNMSLGEHLIPAADLAEQISTPNLEACATTNMKASLNGAVIMASKCGSNMEMIGHLGTDNTIAFGRNAEDIETLRDYRPWELVDSCKHLKEIFLFIEQSLSQFPDGHAVHPLLATLRDSDPFFVLADFEDYIEKQNTVDTLYNDHKRWLSMSLMNIAHSGYFSSDRTVKQYAEEFWHIEP
jgi:starch phosphorylase